VTRSVTGLGTGFEEGGPKGRKWSQVGRGSLGESGNPATFLSRDREWREEKVIAGEERKEVRTYLYLSKGRNLSFNEGVRVGG